jgi:hypothetical protein
VRLIASATTEWASAFGSCGRLRLPRFLPLGQPPSLAFSRAALVLAFDFTLPMRAPTLISFPQCGHFIAPEYRTVRSLHDEFQKTPLPEIPTPPRRARSDESREAADRDSGGVRVEAQGQHKQGL